MRISPEEVTVTLYYKGYIGAYTCNKDDHNTMHGRLVNIKKDVVTFGGETGNEMAEAFRDSVNDYLASCRDRGEEPERPS